MLRWVAGQLGRGSCRTFTDALHFLRSCPPDNDPLEFIFGDLAGLALVREDWAQAEALAREAVLLSEKVGRQELIAAACLRLGISLARQGKKDEALPYTRRSVDVYTRLISPELDKARATLRECED